MLIISYGYELKKYEKNPFNRKEDGSIVKILKEKITAKHHQNKDGIVVKDDCFNTFKSISDNSVDLILTDLPYGITQNKWDEVLPLDQMWSEFNRIIKENGAIVLTATQPFASRLIASNLKNFKYDLIWEKTIASGQLNVKRMPLRTHEHILIFYKKQPTYNEQKTAGEPYQIKRKADYQDGNYGKQKDNEKVNDGFRHAKSVIKISNPRVKGGHPTQKPLELMEYLIKIFSNENDVVLDCCAGSGTTLIAAKNLKRHYFGIELDENYYKTILERLKGSK